MQVKNLKRYFLVRLIKPGLLFTLTIVIWEITVVGSKQVISKLDAIKGNNLKLESELSEVRSEITESETAFSVWEKLQKRNFAMNGLRVNEAKKVSDELRQTYLINNLDINLLNPVLRKDTEVKNVGLEYSDLSISFDSYTDTEAFKFIYNFEKKLPGIPIIVGLNINSSIAEVDEMLLNGVKEGTSKKMVETRLSLVWQDFKELKAQDAKETSK